MTWGSDRSGMASSLTRRIEKTPSPRAAATASSTSTRWRADSSMMRSTIASLPRRGFAVDRGPQAALRVEQEVPRGHHRLPLGDPGQDHHLAVGAGPHLDLAWLEAPPGPGDEEVVPLSGVDDRLGGDDEAGGGRQGQVHRRVHARPQARPLAVEAVLELQADVQGAA